MAYFSGYNISPLSEQIIENLLLYRGMTAKQLTYLIDPFPTLSLEKSIYNYLRILKKQGLVVSYKLQENVSKGSLYFLTKSGYDLAKDIFNVEEGQTGSGWISSEPGLQADLADIPYETFKPPLKQSAHHLMLVNFFIQLKSIDVNNDWINHRINLYAAFEYE